MLLCALPIVPAPIVQLMFSHSGRGPTWNERLPLAGRSIALAVVSSACIRLTPGVFGAVLADGVRYR